MKRTSLFSKLSTLIFSGLAVCALMLGGAWLTPATSAFAATGTPPAKDTAVDQRLQKAFQAEQSWLSQQSDNLAKANSAVAKVQAWIEKAKAQGLDTSTVEAALSTSQTQIATAQLSHDTAAGILNGHAGFDGSGNVTDADQARQSVTSARQSLNDAHAVLAQAARDLRTAVNQFRDIKVQQNRLAREQKWLSEQQTNLDKAVSIVSKVQTYITNQKAKGQDTSSLEAALATYQRQLAAAQASHTTAANVLGAHAGFDNSGNVTNPALARQTLTDAHQALSDAHSMLVQAGTDLRKALKDYRESHPATPAPTPLSAVSPRFDGAQAAQAATTPGA